LKVEALTVTAPGAVEPILDDVTFELPPGTRAAVMGANGAGKSILLLALAGAIPSRARRRRVPAPIGLVFQDPDIAWMAPTVAEEIRFALACRGGDAARAAARAERLLFRFGLGSVANRSPETLSGGERQRLQLAIAVADEPRTLLLDEPTAHLDPGAAAGVESALRDLVGSPETIIRATHDPEVAAASDRLLVIAAGRLVADGDARALLAHEPPPEWGLQITGAAAVGRRLVRRSMLPAPVPLTWSELETRIP
jgi:energy-coupling factor transporter ATP-binding protein EcfA2